MSKLLLALLCCVICFHFTSCAISKINESNYIQNSLTDDEASETQVQGETEEMSESSDIQLSTEITRNGTSFPAASKDIPQSSKSMDSSIKTQPVRKNAPFDPGKYITNDDEFIYTVDNDTITIHRFQNFYVKSTVVVPSVIEGKPVRKINERTFHSALMITSIVIPDSVEIIGDNAFAFCEDLTSITFSKNLKEIGKQAFSACINLEEVTIPESVTSIGGALFLDCYNLKSVTIPKSVTAVKETELYEKNLFPQCKSLSTINLDPENPVFSIYNGVLYNKDFSELIACPAKKTGIYNVHPNTKVIKKAAFICENIGSVILPEGLEKIESIAFNCVNTINKIIIPSTVTHIGILALTKFTSIYFEGDKPTTDGNILWSTVKPKGEITVYYHADKKGWDDIYWFDVLTKSW